MANLYMKRGESSKTTADNRSFNNGLRKVTTMCIIIIDFLFLDN